MPRRCGDDPLDATPVTLRVEDAPAGAGMTLKDLLDGGHTGRMPRRCGDDPITPGEISYLSEVDWEIHPTTQCFLSAQHLLASLPSTEEMTLRYIEGYFTTGAPYGLNHAWLSLNGKVIDPTARTNPGQRPIIGEFPSEWEYLGVELEPGRWPHSTEHGTSSILDDWECGWPMLAATAPTLR